MSESDDQTPENSTPRELVLKKLESMGVNPKRALGQNFLISEIVISRIIEAAKKIPVQNKQIIEVGPGLGALTEKLMELEGRSVQVIELDALYAEHWRSKGLTVHEVDALRFDWKSLGEGFLLVSNLPYQISSRLVVELTCCEQEIAGMVLMFQREVAQRITAKPKSEDYGLLSVIAQNFWQVDLVSNAGQKDFFPAPNVGSRVLRFQPIQGSKVKFYGTKHKVSFLTFVKAAFAKRRKLLTSNLRALGANDWGEALRRAGINEKARAEDLSPQMFEQLYLSVVKEWV